MANRNFARPWCYQKMLTILTGKFTTNASGVVTSSVGIGYTVSRTGVGLYRLIIEDQFTDLHCADVTLVEPTLTALKIAPKTNYTNITTQKGGFIEFQIVNTAAAATDVAQISEIHFRLFFKNTSVVL